VKGWIAGGAAIALVLVFALWVLNPFSAAVPRSATKTEDAGTAPRARESSAASPITPGVPTPESQNVGLVEFCGIGKLPIDMKDPSASFTYLATSTRKKQAEWFLALRNSDDNRARAAGLFLQGIIMDRDTDEVLVQEARDELAQLAAAGRDPAIYAIAYYKCGIRFGVKASGSCAQLSANGWAQLDGDNATPWLMLAGEARANNDSAGERQALRRAANAATIMSYGDSLFAFAEPELPKDATPLERAYFAAQAIGAEAAIAQPQYVDVTRHCTIDAAQDAGARLECSNLAELLVANGRTLPEFDIGENIGKQARWPTARIDALEREKSALTQAMMQILPSRMEDIWTCGSVARLNAFVTQRIQLGEIGAARQVQKAAEAVP
jgi:hypothetical protein